MSFGSFEADTGAPRAEINMVPLIDVMLVLLVIFMVTASVSQAVKLQLPRASAVPLQAPKDPLRIAIDAQRQAHWNGEALSREALAERLAALGQRNPASEIQLLADETVPYGDVAKLIADAAQAGLTRIQFVTKPDAIRR
ncbi:biopolymer transporter ExbD [Niveibacterium sp. 24ML]|uniref:ExbD/TolR family protein n=1 Tax=Niveibacterium sp. 24ML TaxID=2985512 RepID=UPI00226DD5AD|nr:biopolymer transporter ExbD [Niveibacterium sp. 24ML]MCX9157369.1 biopolymer transporter ExbD [Niveibacterium sp. 24ML]